MNLTDLPGITLPPEGESSYADNALGKARAVAQATGDLALADDSGIEVDALGGARRASARYGGEGLSDAERCAKLLEALKGVTALSAPPAIAASSPSSSRGGPRGDRRAAARRQRKAVDGILVDQPVGTGGFGHDPIFYYPPLDSTFAQLAADEKHTVSHRGSRWRAPARLKDWRRAGCRV